MLKSRIRTARAPRRPLIEPLETRTFLSSYFVSPTGSDTAAGTATAPWKTLTRAAIGVKSGDSLTLMAGTYAGNVTFTAPNVTIQAAPGTTPVISTVSNNKNILWSVDFATTASGSSITGINISGGYYYALKLEDSSNTQGASNILVDSCTLHDSGSDVIKITPGCDHVTIRNCEIYNSGLRDKSNAEGIDNVNGDYMLVQNCYIHNTACNGIFAKGGAIGVIIERNRIDHTGFGGVLLGQDTDKQYFDTTADPKLYENIDGTVRNNIISNTGEAGIATYSALRPNILNNTLINVAQSSQGGIVIAPNTRRLPSQDITILNNIVTVSTSRPIVDIRSNGIAGGFTSNNNRYFNTTGAGVYWDERIKNYKLTLAQWKTDVHSDSASTEGNPGVDSTGHLLATSPCIGAGQVVSSVINDFDGDPRTITNDIGADQYVAST